MLLFSIAEAGTEGLAPAFTGVVALLSIDPVPLYVIEEVAGTSFNAIRFFTGWSVSGRDKLGEQISGTFYTPGRKHVRFYFIVSGEDGPFLLCIYE